MSRIAAGTMIAVIYDVRHPLIEQIQERISTRGAMCELVHWSSLGWSAESTTAFAAKYDAVYLDRMGESSPAYATQLGLATAIEDAGVPITNRPGPYWLARNKGLTALECERHGIPTPKTLVAHTLEQVLSFVDPGFGPAYICKSLLGCCAEDVHPFAAKNPPIEEIGKMLKRDGAVIVQQFVHNPDRYIWRIDIVNGQIVVANQRHSFNDDALPLCNGTQGGKIVFHNPSDVPEKVADLALKATSKLRLDIAGVDILRSETGELFLAEVNPEPDITLDRFEFPYAIADFVLSTAEHMKIGFRNKRESRS